MDPRRLAAWIDLGLGLLAVSLVGWRWSQSPNGQIALAKAKLWWEVQTEGCEGCQARKEALRRLRNRIMYDAERIVETGGADVEVVPDVVDRD